MSYPDNNPKTAVGVTKVPLHLVPPVAEHHMAMAFADGARKYGPYNWREKTVSTSVYVGAIRRHLAAYWDGENESSDARVHHLGHIMACCAILLDAESIGRLNDDRPPAGAVAQLQDAYAERSKPSERPESEPDRVPAAPEPQRRGYDLASGPDETVIATFGPTPGDPFAAIINGLLSDLLEKQEAALIDACNSVIHSLPPTLADAQAFISEWVSRNPFIELESWDWSASDPDNVSVRRVYTQPIDYITVNFSGTECVSVERVDETSQHPVHAEAIRLRD